jgi:hypothetical protein
MKKLTLLLIAFLLFAAPVFAQSGDNAQAGDSEPVRGVVTGRVLTGTEGGALPTTGEPMLHILDNAAQEQGMEHSELLADGTFRFEAVPFVPGWQYVAMLNYQNVTYFSEPAPIVEGRTELDISVTVYGGWPRRTHLIVSPTQAVLHLLVTLFDPHAQAVEPHHFGQADAGQRTVWGLCLLRQRQVRHQIPGSELR